MAKVTKGKIANRTGGVETEDGRTLYGFDAECYVRMKSKEDPLMERKIGEWIEKIIEPDKMINVSDLYTSLKDGMVLCKLMNKISAGIIPKFSTKVDKKGNLHPLMERENIGLYLEACWKIGVTSDSMFIVADLHGRRGMTAVCNNLAALSNLAKGWGITAEPIGIMKKPLTTQEEKLQQQAASGGAAGKMPKWSVPLPGMTMYTEQAEDDVEALEEEVHSLKQQCEEAQRTISKLEHSKTNLAELLKTERKKNLEAEKEMAILKKSATGGAGGYNAHQQKYIEDLKKEKDTMQKEIQRLSKLQADQNVINSLRSELEVALETKNQLEAKMQKVPAEMAQLERLKGRVKDLEKENLNLLSQGSHGGGGDSLVQKIKLLEDEKSAMMNDYEKKIASLNDNIKAMDEELEVCLQTIEEIQEENSSLLNEKTEIHSKMEETLRSNRQSISMDFTKFLNEIEQLKAEKTMLTTEYENSRKQYENQVRSLEAESKSRAEEVAVKFEKITQQKDRALREQDALKTQYEQETAKLKKRLDERLIEVVEEVERLKKEKAALTEKLFEETRKLSQSLFDKESLLQQAVQTNEKLNSEASASAVLNLQREIKHVTDQFKIEKDKLIHERAEATAALEKQLAIEKKKILQLTEEFEAQKESLQAKNKDEKQRLEADIEELMGHIETLEKKEGSQVSPSGLSLGAEEEKKYKQLYLASQKEKLAFENRIREIEQQMLNLEEERDSLKSVQKSELDSVKQKSQIDTERLRNQIDSLEKNKSRLLKDLQSVEEAKKQLADDASTMNRRFLEELSQMRGTFNNVLTTLNGGQSGVTLEGIMASGVKWEEKYQELLQKNKTLEAQLKKGDSSGGMDKDKLIQVQEKLISEYKVKLAAALSGQGQPANQPASNLPAIAMADRPNSSPAPVSAAREGAKPGATKASRAAMRDKRKSVVAYLEKNTVEDDIKRLKDTVEKLMLGEPVTLDTCLSFKNLFKIDNGRRVLCFLLKECSECATDKEPYLLSFSSYEGLKELINGVLAHLNLSDGSDFISGRLLLECSSLIARESKKGLADDVTYIQAILKPHKCWRNTFFWEEYFWAQISPKFEELTLDTKEEEYSFFLVEIVEFAKSMWGWGSLSANAIILFAESLANKVEIPDEKTQLITRMVEDFCNKQLSAQADSKKKAAPEKIIKMSDAQRSRRTTAFSAVQIQDSFKEFETYSDGFKPKEEVPNQRKPDWLDNVKSGDSANRLSSGRSNGQFNSPTPRQGGRVPVGTPQVSHSNSAPSSQPGTPDMSPVPERPQSGEHAQVKPNKTISVDRKHSTLSPSVSMGGGPGRDRDREGGGSFSSRDREGVKNREPSHSMTSPRMGLSPQQHQALAQQKDGRDGLTASQPNMPAPSPRQEGDRSAREQRNREQRKAFTKTVALDNRFINNLLHNDQFK